MSSTPSSEERTAAPSPELALLAALIVSSHQRSWLSRPVTHLLEGGERQLQWLSRLKARLLPRFEELLAEATRPGRPPREPEPDDEAATLRELLALVPHGVWERLPEEARRKIVAAQERLQKERGLTQIEFCEHLNLSPRTFRSWKEKERKLPEPPENRDASEKGDSQEKDSNEGGSEPKRKRSPRSTGRFDLTATMPGNQPKACRCRTRACDRYFAGILRKVRDELRPRRREERERRRRSAESRRAQLKERKERQEDAALLHHRPEVVLAEALDLVNRHWIEQDQALFVRGRGLGTYRMRKALESMGSQDRYTVRDRAESVWKAWTSSHRPSGERLASVRAVFDEILPDFTESPGLKPVPRLRFLERR